LNIELCHGALPPRPLTSKHFAQHGGDLIRIIIQAPHKTRVKVIARYNGIRIPVRQDQDSADIVQQPFHQLYFRKLTPRTGYKHGDRRLPERVHDPADQAVHGTAYFGFRDGPHYGIPDMITDPISCEQEYLHGFDPLRNYPRKSICHRDTEINISKV
jgi:hypothetical protein